MHTLLVIAAFALAAVTPFMSGTSCSDQIEFSDDSAEPQPDEDEPKGDQA